MTYKQQIQHNLELLLVTAQQQNDRLSIDALDAALITLSKRK
jgi:hypothetical protein